MNGFILRAAMLAAATVTVAMPAAAADNMMQVCGAKYQAAKKANTLPAGQNWAQFLAQCRGSKTAPAAPAASAAPVAAASPAGKVSHLPGQQSPAMVAMHDRQRQCGQQWKTDKAAGKIPAGQTWPKYWSACNARLKG